MTHGPGFGHDGAAGFSVRAGNSSDMRRLMAERRKEAPQLGTGVVHLWSLDTETTESMTTTRSCLPLGSAAIGVLQLIQALAGDGAASTSKLLAGHSRGAAAR